MVSKLFLDFDFYLRLSSLRKNLLFFSLIVFQIIINYSIPRRSEVSNYPKYVSFIFIVGLVLFLFIMAKKDYLASIRDSVSIYLISHLRALVLMAGITFVIFLIQLMAFQLFSTNYEELSFLDGKLKWIGLTYIGFQILFFTNSQRKKYQAETK